MTFSDSITRGLDPRKRVEHNLKDHKPESQDAICRIDRLRFTAKHLGHLLAADCPDVPERNKALDNLELTLMWAIAAVLRNQDDATVPAPHPFANPFADRGPIRPL